MPLPNMKYGQRAIVAVTLPPINLDKHPLEFIESFKTSCPKELIATTFIKNRNGIALPISVRPLLALTPVAVKKMESPGTAYLVRGKTTMECLSLWKDHTAIARG